MKTLLIVVLMTLTSSVAFAEITQGSYGGITVQISAVEARGDAVIIDAHDASGSTLFVLACKTSWQNCSFPKTGGDYRVISRTEKGVEWWGLYQPETPGRLITTRLTYAGSK